MKAQDTTEALLELVCLRVILVLSSLVRVHSHLITVNAKAKISLMFAVSQSDHYIEFPKNVAFVTIIAV